ncbi:MAG: NADH-quinone oxidoreductase subunit H [Acidobacteria bacterium]|nr:NADH-quinone oxidoreductase subunit H [Acidobacteriota bacterium]
MMRNTTVSLYWFFGLAEEISGSQAFKHHLAASTGLGEIIERTAADSLLLINPGHLLAFVAFFIVALAETGRLPIDNPATHLELTMIHEAMVLEYSGPNLALVEWAAAMKLFLFLALLANLFFPWGVATALAPAALILALGALVVKLGLLALLCTYGVPFVVEIGVFLDVLVAVLIMEVFIYRIKENFDSIDLDQMRTLRE